jgi:hypothetical protein
MLFRSSEKPLPKESFKDGRISLIYPQVDPRMIRKIEWTFKILDAEGRESNPVKVVLYKFTLNLRPVRLSRNTQRRSSPAKDTA